MIIITSPKTIREAYHHACHAQRFGDDDFKEKVIYAGYEGLCRDNFAAMCYELKTVGVTTVWVGSHPTEFEHWNDMSMIFATHPTKTENTRTSSLFWDITDKYFPCSCGNGGNTIVQRQFAIQLPESLRGEHTL